MKEYTFFTNKNGEIKEHKLKADSAKQAYNILKESNYLPSEISMAGWEEA